MSSRKFSFRASYRCVNGHPIGVIDNQKNDLDLLEVNGVDNEYVTLRTSPVHQWWIYDIDYFHRLVGMLEDMTLIAPNLSPYRSLLLSNDTNDAFPIEVARALFKWNALPPTCKPFDYQLEALYEAIIKHDGRSMTALVPGSGKTLVGVLFLYYWMYEMELCGDVLIICECSKVLDWYADWRRWTGKGTRRVMVMSYAAASLRSRELIKHGYDAIVVDECHKIKNYKTQRSIDLAPLIQSVPYVLFLSGTPQVSRVSELYNQLRCIRPYIFVSRDAFLKRYASGKIVNGSFVERDLELPWELDLLLDKVIYRRSDVVPTSTVKLRHLMFSTPTITQMADQDKMLKHRTLLNLAISKEKLSLKKVALIRTRNNHIMTMLRKAGVWKSTNAIPIIRDIVTKSHPRERIVFFSHQKRVLNAVKIAVDAMGLGESVMANGDTPPIARKRLVNALSAPYDGNGPRFGFFTQYMGVGVTLCPGVTVAVILELDSSPAAMRQMEDRLWRVGTTQEVNIYWIACKYSQDLEVMDAIQSKAEDINRVMGKFEFVTPPSPN